MLLRLDGITKTFSINRGVFTALDDVSLHVDEGEIVGLIGPSGSGKSTIAAIATGLEPADAGSLMFDGVECPVDQPIRKRSREWERALRGMQMVFQHPAASFSARMRIGRGVAEGVAYSDIPRSQHEQLVLEAFDQVHLPRSYVDRYPWELSGGECQRAAIARAIVSKPKLLICDEPTSALDVTVQAQIVNLISELCREMHMTCLFISHDLALVYGLCERVYVMDAGRIVEKGPTAQVFENPQSDAAKLLVSSVATF